MAIKDHHPLAGEMLQGTVDLHESVFSYPTYRRLRDNGRAFSGAISSACWACGRPPAG